MKIYRDLQQGSPEWHRLRAKNFTASELGPFAVEPVRINVTVEELKAKLDECGIPRVGLTSKRDLLERLTDHGVTPEPELCDGARTAIIDKITQEKRLAIESRPFESLTLEDQIWLERDKELTGKEERQFGFNIPVKYGKELEPFARDYYSDKTGFDVIQVGFIEHDSGGFGCSPDGLVYTSQDGPGDPAEMTHGIEIKCPIPQTHIRWLLAGTLPDEHKIQCHAGMAVTGLNRWDFLSYCPGDPPFHIVVLRDDFTRRLEAGLKTLVAEKAKMKAKLARLWKLEFGEEDP